MGQWSIHIEGHGIHDNGRDDDADAMLERFCAELAAHHQVRSATFTVGSARELSGGKLVYPSLPDVGPVCYG